MSLRRCSDWAHFHIFSLYIDIIDIVIFLCFFLIMLCRSFQLFGEHAEDHQQLERGFAQVHPCASDTNHKCRVSQMCVRWCQLAPWIICSFPFWSDMSLSKIDQNRDTPENPTLWSSWFNGEPTDLGYTVFWQTHNTRDTNTWNVSTTRWCMVWDGCVGFNKFDLVNRSKSVGAWSYGWLFLPLGSCMTLQDFTGLYKCSIDISGFKVGRCEVKELPRSVTP